MTKNTTTTAAYGLTALLIAFSRVARSDSGSKIGRWNSNGSKVPMVWLIATYSTAMPRTDSMPPRKSRLQLCIPPMPVGAGNSPCDFSRARRVVAQKR